MFLVTHILFCILVVCSKLSSILLVILNLVFNDMVAGAGGEGGRQTKKKRKNVLSARRINAYSACITQLYMYFLAYYNQQIKR